MGIDVGRRSIVEWASKAPEEGGEEFVPAATRFVAEAQTTSQLDHPGIPPVHDIGIDQASRPYFTMKLVRGRTFGQVTHDLLLRRRGYS